MDIYEKQIKSRLNWARTNGLLTAAIGVTAIFLYFFKVVNPWFSVILLSYCMAMSFYQNSTYQELKVGRIYGIINLICAVFFLIATIGIIVYSFVTGEIRI
ncbi:MAG: hypothetical protein NC218_12280 [Acetobacter sp.]|nr:hypothetical protein [Acetobacter sp.]